ncbi:PASTA domain-containing protein [Streptomyces albidoflavus]|uniref:PASTA domain-containing protein n=1 Tax=Streptomyces albidoflavus TaxID=1886 RepID=UPI0033F88B6D
MKKKITLGKGAGIALAAFVGLGVLGAVVGEEEKAPAVDVSGEAREEKASKEPRKAVDEAGEQQPEDGELPGMVGENLQFAQDSAQAAGFYVLDDQDASGLGRLQVMDRNWTVCSQEPGPGTYPVDTKVTFYAVKTGESC